MQTRSILRLKQTVSGLIFRHPACGSTTATWSSVIRKIWHYV